MLKKIIIPMAAFAVTATGVSAFNQDTLDAIDVELTSTQKSALEEAYELKKNGADREEVIELLTDAGLDRELLKEIREAAREHKQAVYEEVKAALYNADFVAYQTAVADTPRADLISTEAAFERLVEAHELRASGDREGAREIMSELGFEKPTGKKGGHHERGSR